MKCASLRWCGFVDHQGSQLLPNSGSSMVFLFCHLTTLVVCNLNVFVIPRSTPSSATYLRMAPRGSSAHDGDDNSHSEFIHEAAKNHSQSSHWQPVPFLTADCTPRHFGRRYTARFSARPEKALLVHLKPGIETSSLI